jgi:hypothetical protein
MASAEPAITSAEADILRSFRNYGLRAHEMLFFNRNAGKAHSPRFNEAMQAMINRGLVIREKRHRDAYSLSTSGYQVSLSVGKA